MSFEETSVVVDNLVSRLQHFVGSRTTGFMLYYRVLGNVPVQLAGH